MRSRPIHEYHEGSQAKSRFVDSVKKIRGVPRDEMERRAEEYKKKPTLKPKRGPQPQANALVAGGKTYANNLGNSQSQPRAVVHVVHTLAGVETPGKVRSTKA